LEVLYKEDLLGESSKAVYKPQQDMLLEGLLKEGLLKEGLLKEHSHKVASLKEDSIKAALLKECFLDKLDNQMPLHHKFQASKNNDKILKPKK